MTQNDTPAVLGLSERLGPLPERAGILSGCTSTPPFVHWVADGFTADQMRAYAAQEADELRASIQQALRLAECSGGPNHMPEIVSVLRLALGPNVRAKPALPAQEQR